MAEQGFVENSMEESKRFLLLMLFLISLVIWLEYSSSRIAFPKYEQLSVTKGTLKNYTCRDLIRSSHSLTIKLNEFQDVFKIYLGSRDDCESLTGDIKRNDDVILKYGDYKYYEVVVGGKRILKYEEKYSQYINSQGYMKWIILFMVCFFVFVDLHRKNSLVRYFFSFNKKGMKG